VRPTAIVLTLLVLTAACETSTEPGFFGIGGGGGTPVTAAEATGNWSLTLRRTTVVCNGGFLADLTVITAHLDVLADGTVNGATSTWQTSSTTTIVFPVTGRVTLSTGDTKLILTGGNGTQKGMELRGGVTASGTFSGTLQDPAAGLFPIFSGQECNYSAAGTKA